MFGGVVVMKEEGEQVSEWHCRDLVMEMAECYPVFVCVREG